MVRILAALGVVFIAFSVLAQAPVTDRPGQPLSQQDRKFAVNLTRAINTAELALKHQKGAYANWPQLVASEQFADALKWASRMSPELSTTKLSAAPDAVPGWELRLNLTADGNHYDLMLSSVFDQNCRFAVFSDERGLIRQGTVIGCPAP